MTKQYENHVVFELIADVKNYVADFGIANGEVARFSYLTNPDLKQAIPLELFQAQAVCLMLREQWPLKHWFVSTLSGAAA